MNKTTTNETIIDAMYSQGYLDGSRGDRPLTFHVKENAEAYMSGYMDGYGDRQINNVEAKAWEDLKQLTQQEFVD